MRTPMKIDLDSEGDPLERVECSYRVAAGATQLLGMQPRVEWPE